MNPDKPTRIQMILHDLFFWSRALQYKELCRLGLCADRLKRIRKIQKLKGYKA